MSLGHSLSGASEGDKSLRRVETRFATLSGMSNIPSSLLAGSYAAAAPWASVASSACTVNGQPVECPGWLLWLIPFFIAFWFIFVALAVLVFVALWKVFAKAGKPGWAALIPVYNVIVILEIVGKPIWWIFLYFVPFANIVMGIIVANELAKSFGKGVGFTLGLIFLPMVFYPILGFGKAVYIPASPVQS